MEGFSSCPGQTLKLLIGIYLYADLWRVSSTCLQHCCVQFPGGGGTGMLPAGTLTSALPFPCSDVPLELSDTSLLSSVAETRQLMDAAYKRTWDIKKNLQNNALTPAELLSYFKQPVGGTREAVQAADYLQTTLSLLKEKLRWAVRGDFNVTDLLTPAQVEVIFKATVCDQQDKKINCASSGYRTITGECNNRRNPSLGASNRALARWLPAEYEDGVSVPRGWTEGRCFSGFLLPLVRQASNKIVRFPLEQLWMDQQRSLMFMWWGQSIDHDLDFSPESPSVAGQTGSCLAPSPEPLMNFPFLYLQIPPNEPRITNRRDCLPFFRSAAACQRGRAVQEQINALTSFLDGREAAMAQRLWDRNSQKGLLAVNHNFTDRGREYMPFGPMRKEPCLKASGAARIPCFLASDKMLGLACMHTLFLQEHNCLVGKLRSLNPHWNDERLYQEAQKVLGAMIQIITYRDYLSLLLGCRFHRLIPRCRGYNESMDSRISNVFALAFRSAHASVPPTVGHLDEYYRPITPEIQLRTSFFAVWRIIQEGGIDPYLRSLMADQLWDRLFEEVERIGFDLAALNMQRGCSDIQLLAGYNSWRKFCGLSQPSGVKSLGKFLKIYGTPKSIDIWIGALAEPFVKGGRVGPPMACLIGTQFRNIRDGDRFWWQNPGVFTPCQCCSLAKISLSRIICDNTHITKVSRNIFQANRLPPWLFSTAGWKVLTGVSQSVQLWFATPGCLIVT
uniref:Eosinophil peroxidase n=1 Tax=Serinus canaria TaxID=9135 RepID=A0A8C9U659_SERCA